MWAHMNRKSALECDRGFLEYTGRLSCLGYPGFGGGLVSRFLKQEFEAAVLDLYRRCVRELPRLLHMPWC